MPKTNGFPAAPALVRPAPIAGSFSRCASRSRSPSSPAAATIAALRLGWRLGAALLLVALLGVALATPVAAQTPSATGPSVDEAIDRPHLRVELGLHAGPVRGVAVSADGVFAVTVSDDKTARIWRIADGELQHVLRPTVGAGALGSLYGVSTHPTEDLVAVGGATGGAGAPHRILLFRISTGEFVRAIDARAGDVTRLAWTSDGSLLLASYRGDNGFRAFSPDGRLQFEARFAEPSYGLAVAPTGLIAVSSYDGQVRLYRHAGGRIETRASLRTTTPAPRGLAFSADGSRLAIGYRGTDGNLGAPTVHDAQTGQLLFGLPRPRLAAGNLANVAFAADGATLLAGGSGYAKPGRHPIVAFDLASRREIASGDVAGNTINDLVAQADGGVVFASFDGTWGRADARLRATASASLLADLRGPANLRVSDDGRRIGLYGRLDAKPMWFDLGRRLVTTGPHPGDLRVPRLRGAAAAQWENTHSPRVNGRAIAMSSDEIARSIVFEPDGRGALLGTSRRLIRLDESGQVRWERATQAEVLAINTSADGRLIVTSFADGTVRWWRAADGTVVLTLLALPDRRWTVWTPSGHFDAGAGSDGLAGWAVNRADMPVADFHSLNRFRDRFNRPDVIDRLLSASDETSARAAADAAAAAARAQEAAPTDSIAPAASVPAAAAVSPPSSPTSSPQSPPPSSPQSSPAAIPSLAPKVFPPVFGEVGTPTFDPARNQILIPFVVRAGRDLTVEIRVDGRPVSDAQVRVAAAVGPAATGEAIVPAPPTGATVQLIGRDVNGVSEPLGVRFVRPDAPVAAPIALTPVPAVPAAPPPQALADVAAPDPAPGPVSAPGPASAPAAAPAPTPGAGAGVPPAHAPGRATEAAPSPAATAASARPSASPARPESRSKLFALAIGISDYKMPDYKLGLAAKDATDFIGVLQSQQGRLYAKVDTRLLTDREATRDRIQAGFDWLRTSVAPGDVGILFIAGHGMNASSGEYYFLPWEADHRRLATTGISEKAIRTTLSQMRGKALLFVDTCHAGSATGTDKAASRELARLANDLASPENGVIVFASSTGRQLSEEHESWGNGAFTKAVIEGLGGKADFRNTGRITFKALDFYVSDQVDRLTAGRQTPVTISPSGVPDFALARVGAT